MELGKISIIIPVFNSADYIIETLESVKNQTYTNFECICVDDGSTDESVALVKAFGMLDNHFNVVQRPVDYPKGGNACRNYGFTISKGEYIQWFDSDDLMDQNFLFDKISLLRSSDFSYVISRTAYFFDSPLELVEYEQNLYTDNLYFDFLDYKTKFFTPGPMFKREFLENMELFDLGLKRHQEKEFFFRILLKDPLYGVVDKVSIFRRMHEAQLSSSFNNPLLKLVHEFFCWEKIFNHYCKSNIKNYELSTYFKKLFLKYFYRFLKLREFRFAFQCMKYILT